MKKFSTAVVAALTTCIAAAAPSPAFASPQVQTVNSGDKMTTHYSIFTALNCTLTGVVSDESGDLYGITAAHCIDEESGMSPREIRVNGVQIADRESILKAQETIRHDRRGKGVTDMAMFKLNEGIGTSNVIGDTGIAVKGIGSVVEITPGQEICKYGATTGNTCGKVTAVDILRDDIYADILAKKGDSGAPFYIVDEDGEARIYGALSGGPNDYDNYADALEMNMEGWGVKMGNGAVPQSPNNPPSPPGLSSELSSSETPVEKEPLSSIGLSSEGDLFSRIDALSSK